MLARLAASSLALALLTQPATAQGGLKIGFISTLSGPQAALGEEILNGFRLAMEQEGGKLGGVAIDLSVGDDQLKPDVARQLVTRMVKQEGAEIIVGPLNSSVLLAIAAPVLEDGKFLISSNAGPSEMAGKDCHPNFFAMQPQNDVSSEAMGAYLQAKGIGPVFLIASNYAAGRDKMAGFKRFYKGKIVGELYPPFTQLDYSAELAQVQQAKPAAVYTFLPGGVGINFIKQFHGYGLEATTKIYTDIIDQTMLPAVGTDALGVASAAWWTGTMKSDLNAKFVADYDAKFHRMPSIEAAEGYDTARLVGSALKETGGKVADKAAFRKALAAASFQSLRGKFRFDRNHFPLADEVLTTVAKDERGRLVFNAGETIFADHHDAYVDDCRMAAD
jgi:branched-chain amino acid transport system substrate-binding protein